ncbi:unnamed protein product, partial [Vitis vinifera]|uniref:Uncharacterized protein n=1 Tax=Vitis vinifera TaxID=29760 RepID=D7TSM9_VITVI
MKINLGLSGLDQLKRPKFMMDDCFGLAHESIRLGLGLEPGPFRVDERLYANPSKKILSFNLILV